MEKCQPKEKKMLITTLITPGTGRIAPRFCVPALKTYRHHCADPGARKVLTKQLDFQNSKITCTETLRCLFSLQFKEVNRFCADIDLPAFRV